MSIKTFLKDIFHKDTSNTSDDYETLNDRFNEVLAESKNKEYFERHEKRYNSDSSYRNTYHNYMAELKEYDIAYCSFTIDPWLQQTLTKDGFVYNIKDLVIFGELTDQQFTALLTDFFKHYDEYQNNKKALEARKIQENK